MTTRAALELIEASRPPAERARASATAARQRALDAHGQFRFAAKACASAAADARDAIGTPSFTLLFGHAGLLLRASKSAWTLWRRADAAALRAEREAARCAAGEAR